MLSHLPPWRCRTREIRESRPKSGPETKPSAMGKFFFLPDGRGGEDPIPSTSLRIKVRPVQMTSEIDCIPVGVDVLPFEGVGMKDYPLVLIHGYPFDHTMWFSTI